MAQTKVGEGIGKLITLENSLILAGVVFLGIIMFNYKKEQYKGLKEMARANDPMRARYDYQDVSQENVPSNQADYSAVMKVPQELAANYKKIFPDDLLPLDKEETDWSRSNPAGKGSLELKNMLSAGQHLGVNTQGSSLKNANQQIRSEPPNPILPISIWRNSSITPDIYRKQLEIGESVCL